MAGYSHTPPSFTPSSMDPGHMGKRSRTGSISGRLRSASDLCDDGAISREDKGLLKDLIIADHPSLDQAFTKAQAGDTGHLHSLIREGRRKSLDKVVDDLDLDGMSFGRPRTASGVSTSGFSIGRGGTGAGGGADFGAFDPMFNFDDIPFDMPFGTAMGGTGDIPADGTGGRAADEAAAAASRGARGSFDLRGVSFDDSRAGSFDMSGMLGLGPDAVHANAFGMTPPEGALPFSASSLERDRVLMGDPSAMEREALGVARARAASRDSAGVPASREFRPPAPKPSRQASAGPAPEAAAAAAAQAVAASNAAARRSTRPNQPTSARLRARQEAEARARAEAAAAESSASKKPSRGRSYGRSHATAPARAPGRSAPLAVKRHFGPKDASKHYVGAYSPEERKERLRLFWESRNNRNWTRQIKYNVRKDFADSRFRVRGRFVKKSDEEKHKSGKR